MRALLGAQAVRATRAQAITKCPDARQHAASQSNPQLPKQAEEGGLPAPEPEGPACAWPVLSDGRPPPMLRSGRLGETPIDP